MAVYVLLSNGERADVALIAPHHDDRDSLSGEATDLLCQIFLDVHGCLHFALFILIIKVNII